MRAIFFLLLITTGVFAQTEATISDAGSKLHYRTFGNGKPILIINGGPGMNSNGFIPLAQRLAKTNQTIIYDQRGTGLSALDKTDSSTVTMDLMVADMETLRKYLKIDKWTILGHSFGGMLASYYATKHPESIQSLIMSSSGGVDLGLMANGNLITEKLTPMQRDSLNYWNNKIAAGDTGFNARIGRGR
ncbi:MAG TPA: alpha/beta fold hydrolase, partial [Flavobacterium sp.]|nr:alpha/beta fold hydrolase [Flavobacterium sp.]